MRSDNGVNARSGVNAQGAKFVALKALQALDAAIGNEVGEVENRYDKLRRIFAKSN